MSWRVKVSNKGWKLPENLLNQAPWPLNKTPIWPASTFILRRNLAGKLFPEKMSQVELKGVKELIKAALENSKVLQNPRWIEAVELNQKERDFLYEHFFTLEEVKSFNEGQAFCIDDSGKILITINFIDHLCIHFIDSNSDWKDCYEKLSSLKTELSSQIPFAHMEGFGFLTADSSLCGSAFSIESLLHIPLLLLENKPVDLMHHLDNGIMLSSLQRNLEFTGDIAMLLNNYTLGMSEEQILDLMHRNSITLMNMEKELQQKAKANISTSMRDRVSRAYGTLMNSCQMEAKEALSAISTLKLGFHLEMVSGIDLEGIHNLFFNAQRAHLLCHLPKEGNKGQILEHRAEFLKDKLKALTLKL